MQPLRKKDSRYTYADYYSWDDSERWELIEGVPYAMSPAPTWKHQLISSNIHGQIWQYLRGKNCSAFSSPIDVRLNADTDDNNVVQPDIIVVCDKSKLEDSRACIGAPDMVVEVLSPSTEKHDRLTKFKLYLNAGVREYWIVDPESKMVQVNILNSGKYTISAYGETDSIPVHVLDGCIVDLAEVFEPGE